MDALDTAVESSLSIMNLEISAGEDEDDDVEEDNNEPENGELTETAAYGNVSETETGYSVSTGSSAVSQNVLEKNLGLITNILDSNLNSTKGAIDATEGSAIQGSGEGKVGDAISFDYSFSTNDYVPFKDFSFYSVNNKAYKIAAIGEDVANKGSTSGTITYAFKDSDFGGDLWRFQIRRRSHGRTDTVVDTTLTVDNFVYIEDESDEDDNSDDIDLTITTFGDSYKSGNQWKMSTGFGSISQSELEQSLSMVEGSLDGDMESIDTDALPKPAIDATEGSGLVATASGVEEGDELSFSYTFKTSDYLPYDDFSFISINGTTKEIESVETVGNFGEVTKSYNYYIQEGDLLNEAGDLVIALGVVDAKDTAVTTKFSVWDLALTSGVDDEEDEENEAVDDPGGDEPDVDEEGAFIDDGIDNGDEEEGDGDGDDDPDEGVDGENEATTSIEFQEFGNTFNSTSGVITMSTGYGAVCQYEVEQKLDFNLEV